MASVRSWRQRRFDMDNTKSNRKQLVKRLGSIVVNAFLILCLLVSAGLAFYLVRAKAGGGVAQVGSWRLYTVLSGSMAPTFDAGSVLAVVSIPPEAVAEGDIITFKDPQQPKNIITHRVVSRQEQGQDLTFKTRGDANNTPDLFLVPAQNVIGKVRLAIPYAGYLTQYIRTLPGLILRIILPALLIIISELATLYGYFKAEEEKRLREKGEQAAEAALAQIKSDVKG